MHTTPNKIKLNNLSPLAHFIYIPNTVWYKTKIWGFDTEIAESFFFICKEYNHTRLYSIMPIIRPPMVLVESCLNSEQVSLMRPVYIENSISVLKHIVLIARISLISSCLYIGIFLYILLSIQHQLYLDIDKVTNDLPNRILFSRSFFGT